MPTENYTSKFKVDVSDLKKGMSEANAAISKANAEFKNATAGTKDWTKSADGLTAKITEQKKVVEEEQKKLELLKQQLERINKAQNENKKIITDLNNKYEDAVKQYGAASAEAKKYEKELSAAEAAQEKNRKAAEKLEIQILNQDTAIKKANAEINDYKDELNKLETEQKQDINSTEELNTQITETGKQAQKTTDGGLNAFTVALGNLAANAITAVIDKLGELATATISAFEEFDKGRDAVIEATGATGDAAKELEKSYSVVAKAVPAELENIGEALGEVSTRFDYTGESLESATEQFLKFSKITKADVTNAVRNVSRAIESGAMDAEDYAIILDQLAKASQVSSISAETLSERLTTYGAQMRALGYDTEDTIAMLAGWEKQGVNTETAITGIRKALANWGKDGKEAKAELASLIEEIKNAPDETTAAALALENFGNKAGTELADVIRSGRFEFQEFADTIANSEGTVSNTFDETQSGLDKISLATQSLKVTLGELGGNILGDIAPKITDVITNLGDALAGDEDAAERFGDSVGAAISSIATKITDLIPKAITLVSSLITNIVTGISENISSDLVPNLITELSSALTTIISTLGDILPDLIEKGLQILPALNSAIFNAIPQVLTGLINFVTALVDKLPDIIEQALETAPKVWTAIAEAIQNNLPKLIEAVDRLLKALVKAFPKILKTITKEIPNLIKTMTSLLSETYPIVIQAAVDLLSAIIDALPQIITAWNEAAPDLIMAIGQALIDNAPLLWETIKQVWSIVFSSIPDLATALFDGLKDIILSALASWKKILSPVVNWVDKNIITPVGDFFSNMWKKFKENASNAWEGVKTVFSKVAEFFGDTFTKAWERVKAVFSTGGKIFDGIKEGIVAAFNATVNAIIRGINKVVTVPFQNINDILDKLQGIEVLGMNPFEDLISRINIPQIPELEYGGILKRGQLGLLEGKNDEAVIPLQNNMEGMRRIAGLLADEMSGAKLSGETVNNYTFTQNVSSPKALSRWDIYRQTKNLMNAMKGV